MGIGNRELLTTSARSSCHLPKVNIEFEFHICFDFQSTANCSSALLTVAWWFLSDTRTFNKVRIAAAAASEMSSVAVAANTVVAVVVAVPSSGGGTAAAARGRQRGPRKNAAVTVANRVVPPAPPAT